MRRTNDAGAVRLLRSAGLMMPVLKGMPNEGASTQNVDSLLRQLEGAELALRKLTLSVGDKKLIVEKLRALLLAVGVDLVEEAEPPAAPAPPPAPAAVAPTGRVAQQLADIKKAHDARWKELAAKFPNIKPPAVPVPTTAEIWAGRAPATQAAKAAPPVPQATPYRWPSDLSAKSELAKAAAPPVGAPVPCTNAFPADMSSPAFLGKR